MHVAILTKNPVMAMRDIDLYQGVDTAKVGTTLTMFSDTDSVEWEPGAPTSRDRVEALKVLAANRVKTWASFEPVIDPEQSLALLDSVLPFIDHVKIGKLNNYRGIDKAVDWHSFLERAVAKCRDAAVPFYVKKDLAEFRGSIDLTKDELDMDALNV
jgi:hypothetical protein